MTQTDCSVSRSWKPAHQAVKMRCSPASCAHVAIPFDIMGKPPAAAVHRQPPLHCKAASTCVVQELALIMQFKLCSSPWNGWNGWYSGSTAQPAKPFREAQKSVHTASCHSTFAAQGSILGSILPDALSIATCILPDIHTTLLLELSSVQ